MLRRSLFFFFLALVTASPAAAQLPLPLPSVGDVLNDVTGTAQDTLDDVDLARLRQARVQDLLRRHPRELERGPEGFPIVRSQIIALSPAPAALEAARAGGFQIVGRDESSLGAVVTLRAPARMSTRRALRQLREADPQGVYDFDHLHLESGAAAGVGVGAKQGRAGAGPRIGMIDSGVSGPVAAQRAFATSAPVTAEHGGAVAALLRSAAPDARLYVADIYGGAPTGGSSSALARALAWLCEQRTPLINVSLVGPRNRVIEAIVAELVARGFIIVAAVGNDGPAAAPLYPAAYAGVVGVTGVDARGRALVEAGRGPQVDFAALGVVSGHGRAVLRGTSYAAPIVTGLIAQRMREPDAAAARAAFEAMRSRARDLGPHGRDNIYGEGLIEIHGEIAAR
jgi:subtilisin family serine protease